jgi:sulfite exporter TauE/SafE/copper chaperone CopZ
MEIMINQTSKRDKRFINQTQPRRDDGTEESKGIIIKLSGLTCPACEQKVEKALSKLEGIDKAQVNYQNLTADILYRPSKVSLEEMISTVEKAGYGVITEEDEENNENTSFSTILHLGIIILGIYIIINNTIGFNFYPKITTNMGYGMLLVAGLFTSIHCIAMCGGISISQCAGCYGCEEKGIYHKVKPSLLYNMGRVTSYTVLGGVVGAIGSVFSVSIETKALISIAAGIFMVLMGINMIGVFPLLRKFMPRLPKKFAKKLDNKKSNKTPYFVGILNGFMPCGPLQAMQLYALASGNFFTGALSMFLFSIGTVPLMLLFGVISTLISTNFTKQMMKVSAILVIILGLIMSNRGLSLVGLNKYTQIETLAFKEDNIDKNKAVLKDGYQTITMNLESGGYESFTVYKDVPLRWIITADEKKLNGCNGEIIVYDYQIDKVLQVGENVIEFTPTKRGTFMYSCWMGMIRAEITVE